MSEKYTKINLDEITYKNYKSIKVSPSTISESIRLCKREENFVYLSKTAFGYTPEYDIDILIVELYKSMGKQFIDCVVVNDE